jgi:hypothetical protein
MAAGHTIYFPASLMAEIGRSFPFVGFLPRFAAFIAASFACTSSLRGRPRFFFGAPPGVPALHQKNILVPFL